MMREQQGKLPPVREAPWIQSRAEACGLSFTWAMWRNQAEKRGGRFRLAIGDVVLAITDDLDHVVRVIADHEATA